MDAEIKLLDVVALLVDIPEQKLRRGEVGTVVEELGKSHVEVEFADRQGIAYAFLSICKDQLLVLHEVKVAQIAA